MFDPSWFDRVTVAEAHQCAFAIEKQHNPVPIQPLPDTNQITPPIVIIEIIAPKTCAAAYSLSKHTNSLAIRFTMMMMMKLPRR